MLRIWKHRRSHAIRSSPRKSSTLKPSLEPLEDRTVPAAISGGLIADPATISSAASSLTEAIKGQAGLLGDIGPFMVQAHHDQAMVQGSALTLLGMAESVLAADMTIFQAWSTAMADLWTSSLPSPAVTGNTPEAAAPSAPPTPQTSQAAATSSGLRGSEMPDAAAVPQGSQAAAGSSLTSQLPTGGEAPARPTLPGMPHLGQFTTLATPFSPTQEGSITAAPGGAYFAAGSNLWFLNDTTGKWSGPWVLPGKVGQVIPLPSGQVAVAVGVGNIDLHNGTTPGQFAVVNPASGKWQLANLQTGYAVTGSVVAGDGSVVAVTTWSGWLAGHSNNKQQQAVWASPDGVHFTLRSAIPGAGALWFLSEATDGSNRLWTGGENANGPFESTDNGVTWHPLGTQNSKGFSGNIWGVVELRDGTLLVQKRLTTSAGQFPLVRGKSGGPFVPSSTGLPPLFDVLGVTVLPTGALIARVGGTGSLALLGGTYVSYDNGNTWSSLVANGVPALAAFGIAATPTHVYVWPQGGPVLVASLVAPAG